MAIAKRDFEIPGNPGLIKHTALWLFQNILPSQFNEVVLRKHQRLHLGRQPAGKKVAVFLIFPKTGILPSHLHSLRYMVENGYAPLIVSNQKLQPADIAALHSLAWMILERLNFGYDFGGYRDAILWLGPHLAQLDRLVLFNDSTWFPLANRMNWLAEAEARSEDYVGAMETRFGKLPGQRERDQSHMWTFDRKRSQFYYGSFALSIGPKLSKNIGFFRFWRKLRLSQGKTRTIRRGEIGLSQWVRAQGFSHGSTTNAADFDSIFIAMDEPDLRRVFNDLIYVQDPKTEAILEKLTQSAGPEGLQRRDIEQLLFLTIGSRGASLAVPRFLVEQKNYSFLKKYAVLPGTRNTAALVALINDLNDPMQQQMLAERGLTSAVSQTADKAV